MYQHDPRNRRVGEGHTIMKWLQTALKQFAVPHAVVGGSSAVVISQSDDDAEFIDTFLGLLDTPDAYTSQALKAVRVNAGATALEFFTQLFTLLGDTPSSYTGQAAKSIRVKVTEDGLEFYTPSGSPGGVNKDIQFNDGGSFGGDTRLTFDKAAGQLGINVPVLMNDNIMHKLKELEIKAQASISEIPAAGYGYFWLKDDSGDIDAYITYDGTSYSLMGDTDTLPQYLVHATVTATGNMTMTANRNIYVPITASTANITLTIPSGTIGFTYIFKRTDATAYTITLSAADGIDGGTTMQLKTQYDAVLLVYAGGKFNVI